MPASTPRNRARPGHKAGGLGYGRSMRKKLALTIAGLLLPLLAGCGLQIPADPEGTLERVAGGTLKAGISHNPPWTETPSGSEPAGTEAELVRSFAAEHDARVEWVAGGESNLIRQLERGELDLVVGGLTKDSPWSKYAALTHPYLETRNAQGDKEQHVMAVRMGENAFMVALEEFLLEDEAGS
jgi:polar amino acid transport system substrate-binding protein